jgi:hypothetical protein
MACGPRKRGCAAQQPGLQGGFMAVGCQSLMVAWEVVPMEATTQRPALAPNDALALMTLGRGGARAGGVLGRVNVLQSSPVGTRRDEGGFGIACVACGWQARRGSGAPAVRQLAGLSPLWFGWQKHLLFLQVPYSTSQSAQGCW